MSDRAPMASVDNSNKSSPYALSHRVRRVLWGVVYALLFRPSPRPLHGWRRMLLRAFGADLGTGARVYSRARVFAPWNLKMGAHSTLGPDVDCYCGGRITIGEHTVVSQYSYLCAATHDFEHPRRPLLNVPIEIGSQVWVCADVFVGPGSRIADGVVVGARSSVFGELPEWTVCTGSPARPRRPRVIRSGDAQSPLATEGSQQP